jgi:hypothetical protein
MKDAHPGSFVGSARNLLWNLFQQRQRIFLYAIINRDLYPQSHFFRVAIFFEILYKINENGE